MNQAEIYVDEEKFTKAKSYYKYLWTLTRRPRRLAHVRLCALEGQAVRDAKNLEYS